MNNAQKKQQRCMTRRTILSTNLIQYNAFGGIACQMHKNCCVTIKYGEKKSPKTHSIRRKGKGNEEDTLSSILNAFDD